MGVKTQSTAQGAASGAAAGTAILPGMGTAIGGAIGGAMGYFSGSGSEKAAEAEAKRINAMREAAARELEAIGIPSIESQRIILENPRLMGELIPEMRAEADQLASAMNEIGTDPRLKDAQMEALASIQERTTGLTPEDEIAMRSTRENVAGQLASADKDIVQNMEQRGMGGSGMELAMRQAGGQSAMRQASEEADRLASMQYQAKMQAMEQAGQMAGGLRTQDFNEQAQKAQSQDAISKFNTTNRMNVDAANVGARNQAQASNLATRQALESQRAGNRNQEEIHNKGLFRDQFDMGIAKASGQNQVAGRQATTAATAGANQAANSVAMWKGIGDGASSAIKAKK